MAWMVGVVAVVGSNWFDGLCFCVCVVMGLDKLIGVSWVSMCVALCVEPVLEVEGEREEIK